MFQCFVICPFGDETLGGKEKELFEQLKGLRQNVFPAIVAACMKDGYEVKISDSREIEHGCAEIKDAVQKCIDEAAAVIVLLSADKPNVYLELGWAQGLWHAPILLRYKGYILPIDINNDLGLEFTDAHVNGTDKPGIEALAGQLAKSIVQRIENGRNEKQFKHWPDTTLARGRIKVYNRFSRAISPAEWSGIIDDAEQEIIFASTAMSRTLEQAFFTKDVRGNLVQTTLDKMLLNKALSGVAVTILMYHEDNVTLGHLKRLRNSLDKIHHELKQSFHIWSTQRLAFETLKTRSEKPTGSLRVIQMRRRHLPFRVTLTERRALVTLRLYTEIYNSGLLIDAPSPMGQVDQYNMPVYTQIRDELNYLIDENSEASETAYQEWRRRQA